MITPEQSLGARAMLRMKLDDLAAAAQVEAVTLFDFEAGRRQPDARITLAIQAALERAGIRFIRENGGGPGVRLAPPAP